MAISSNVHPKIHLTEGIFTQGSVDEIKVFDDVMDEEDFTVMQNYMQTPNWKYGQSSSQKYHSHRQFWYMELQGETFFTEYYFNKIQKDILKEEYYCHRVYANGHTCGQPGALHQDYMGDDLDELNRAYTFLIYIHPDWNLDWGGKTLFIDSYNNVETIVPIPGRCVLFPSRIAHYAEDVSKEYCSLRCSIAYKLFKKKEEKDNV